jgi:hypothetical protein
MPRGGSKPGERRSNGRPKGSLNKLSIGRMKAQLAAREPEFDPYDKLQALAEELSNDVKQERSSPKPNQARIDQLRDMLSRVLRDMVPYKRPRLATMKVQGDKDAPLFDLTQLSDSELAFLRRTILKATPVDEAR